MILVLLGAPGAGKGTQSKSLCARYGLTHLATGDIFRSEIAAKSALGEKASEYVKTGKLVPDNLVTEMVAGRIEPGGKYLLDGFPRNLAQAQSLADIMTHNKAAIDMVLYLDLAREEAIKRLTSRRICGKCGEVYNVLTQPPPASGLCACGGKIEQRADDSVETAQKRLMVFDDLTKPLAAYYKAEQIFRSVDAARDPSQVTAALCSEIDKAASKV